MEFYVLLAPGAPEEFTANPETGTSVKVKWSPPEELNGIITKYYIRWKEEEFEDEDYMVEIETLDLDNLELEVSYLEPCVSYVFYVSAETVAEGESTMETSSTLAEGISSNY